VSIIESEAFRWNPTVMEEVWDRELEHHERMMAEKHLTAEDRHRLDGMGPQERGRARGLGVEAEIQLRHLKRLGYQGIGVDSILDYLRECGSVEEVTPSMLVGLLGGRTVYGEGAE
jgi:hypothetical protein